MKKNFIEFICILIGTLFLAYHPELIFAQKKSIKLKDPKQTIIATVGLEKITYADVEHAFSKNLSKKNLPLHKLPKDSILDFLNLYLRYRLKVNDAIQRGLDKDSSVIQEITQNRRLLAETFYFERKLVEPNVEKMLKNRQYEAQVSYIFIQFPPNPTDTLPSFLKAKNIIEQINKGKDFAQLAKDSSDDKESAERGGLILNFITAGKVQRPIEEAIFSLQPGEVYPNPIRTKFGYFIIKLNKLNPRIKVKASHILLALSPDKDSTKIIQKADSLILLIRNGISFSRLAEEHSDDPASAMRGGEIGWYSRSGGIEPSGKFLTTAFEDALFSLKDGQISDKVFTEYGVHIIKRDSTAYFKPEDDRDDLKKLYKRLYYEEDKRNLVEELEKKYNFFINESILSNLISYFDTTKTTLDTNWLRKIPSEIYPQFLFGVIDKQYSVSDFVKIIQNKSEFRATPLNRSGLTSAMKKIVYPTLIEKATANLEKESPEFASMMKEFRDGILLFKVEAIEVWDKLKFDSTLAYEFWTKNKSKYQTYPIYDVTEIFVLKDSLANQIYDMAISGQKDFEELAKEFTQRAGFREKNGKWGKISAKDNRLAKKLQEMDAKPGILKPFPFENGFSIVKISDYEPQRVKTFQEAIPDFATDVQEILQKKLTETWLEKVKKKIPIKIYNQNLEKVIKELQNL
ncbi:MAG: peptidylprolyl isomerase [Candidatus Kapaibacteriales bacterium]